MKYLIFGLLIFLVSADLDKVIDYGYTHDNRLDVFESMIAKNEAAIYCVIHIIPGEVNVSEIINYLHTKKDLQTDMVDLNVINTKIINIFDEEEDKIPKTIRRLLEGQNTQTIDDGADKNESQQIDEKNENESQQTGDKDENESQQTGDKDKNESQQIDDKNKNESQQTDENDKNEPQKTDEKDKNKQINQTAKKENNNTIKDASEMKDNNNVINMETKNKDEAVNVFLDDIGHSIVVDCRITTEIGHEKRYVNGGFCKPAVETFKISHEFKHKPHKENQQQNYSQTYEFTELENQTVSYYLTKVEPGLKNKIFFIDKNCEILIKSGVHILFTFISIIAVYFII